MPGRRFKVSTVDSFQGEENAVIILSLVRSQLRIGFLAVENRVCVALSRAQRGFYIFGNGPVLCKASSLWWEVIQAMAQDPCRIGFNLPLKCRKHGNKTYVQGQHQLVAPLSRKGSIVDNSIESCQLAALNGGCEMLCDFQLPCGHLCSLKCHP